MKKYKILLGAMLCILIAGFFGSLSIISGQEPSETDIVLLNDIARTVSEHHGETPQYDFGVDYAVFDAQGNMVYSSCETDIRNVTDAVRKRMPCLAMTDGDTYIGSAALLENYGEVYAAQRKKALGALAFTGAAIAVCVVVWGIYVKKRIVAPFGKMERFAEQVAGGRLDFPLEMEKDNLFGAFTESFDIMREELAKSREREEELKRREKELIASLSHDLKTPVTGIKLTAELMAAQTNEPAAIEKLGNIQKKAEQIDALVNDLFTSALKDLGEMKVAVTEEPSDILGDFVLRCDDRRLTESSPIPECIISIDKRRMEQVIGNVITNSYKYANTPIAVSYTINGDRLVMSVRDFGPGVPENELPLVTNKFYRCRSADKADGSGLGLYIAETLTENMNGGLRCLNASPGFEVRIFIPLA